MESTGSDSVGLGGGLSLGLADQGQEAGLGNQAPAAQPDHREFAPGASVRG